MDTWAGKRGVEVMSPVSDKFCRMCYETPRWAGDNFLGDFSVKMVLEVLGVDGETRNSLGAGEPPPFRGGIRGRGLVGLMRTVPSLPSPAPRETRTPQ